MPNVNVTYEEMRTAAGRLANGQQEITTKLEELQKLVNGLVNGGYVTDGSSQKFHTAYEEFTTGAKRTIDGLHSMSSYLTTAANTFEQADKDLSSKLR